MLSQDSLLSRTIIRNCFYRAIRNRNELDHCSNDIFFENVKLAIAQLKNLNLTNLDAISYLLNKRGYAIDKVVRHITEKLFEKYNSWDFILCIGALIEVLTESEYHRLYKLELGENFRQFIYNGYAAHVANYFDFVIQDWLEKNGGWAAFNNRIEVNKYSSENKLFYKFYKVLYFL